MYTHTYQFDTCGCKLGIQREGGVVTSSEFIAPPCAAHAGVDPADAYGIILAENQSKNAVIVGVNAELPEGVDVTGWAFNEDRELLIAIPAGQDVEAAQAIAESASQVPVTVTAE